MAVAVVTGAAGGIGRWIALGLAQAGHRVVLIGRDQARGEAARTWIAGQSPGAQTELVLADLSSMAQTRAAGRAIAARHPSLAILVLNAGVFRTRREPTAEGHEMVVAVNHLSPFVLCDELDAALRAGAPSRIVTIGSSTSDRARIDPQNLELERGWNMVRAYSQSKLAVMMATFTRASHLAGSGVTANVVHPGTVGTGLVRAGGPIGLAWRLMALGTLTEQQGAATPLHAALAPGLSDVTGQYFKARGSVEPNRRARDPDLLARVWTATERLLDYQ